MIQISSQFDSGAITVLDASRADTIRLAIRPDSTTAGPSEFLQWFHFRASGQGGELRGQACRFVLENAGQTTYPDGWPGYAARGSYDSQNWFTLPTRYEGGQLIIECTPEHDSLWIAYFEPYSHARHQALVGRMQMQPGVRHERLGATVDGRDLDLLVMGSGPKPVWVIARQHPGESMAEWFMEGLLEALTDPANDTARQIRQQATLYLVPNMNPDGSVRGNLRVNAAGANLNREWMEPSLTRSPEVLHVRRRMQQTGVALFIDAHGDEAIPYNFISGCEMLPGRTEAQLRQQAEFLADFCAASPDFQTTYGYEASRYSTDALKLASKWVGHTFGCVSLTLEMPFKDNANAPQPAVGWNGARSKALGAAVLAPILKAVARG
jgi:murein tripeptide amidase MpaA